MRDSSGNTLGMIIGSATDFYFRGLNHGSNLRLQQEDAAGNVIDILTGDPDGGTKLFYDDVQSLVTTGGGIAVFDTSGADTSVVLYDSSSNEVGRLRGETARTRIMVGATPETAITCIPNGAVELYYNDIKEAETVSGGLKATNALQIGTSLLADDILDEDNMASDSATALVTQQSVKAYVDAVAGVNANQIINGDFNVAQRGSSFAAVSSGDYTLDRWVMYHSATMVCTITQDTDVPTFAESGHFSENSLKLDVTTGDVALTADQYVYLDYVMEGLDYAKLQDREVTLSFWIKSTATGTMCVSFQNTAGNRCYVSEVTISSADTWEKKTITVTLDSTGTWNTTAGSDGLYINFALALGSNLTSATNNAWGTSGYTGTANQDNFIASADNDILLSQVKLEVGASATNFRGEDPTVELQKCKRYYEKSYNQGVDPGTATTVGMWNLTENSTNSTTQYITAAFEVEKASTPSVSAYDSAGTIDKVDHPSAGKTASVDYIGTKSALIGTTDTTSARVLSFHFIADAEVG